MRSRGEAKRSQISQPRVINTFLCFCYVISHYHALLSLCHCADSPLKPKDAVLIYLLVLRLKDVGTDLLVTLNVPVTAKVLRLTWLRYALIVSSGLILYGLHLQESADTSTASTAALLSLETVHHSVSAIAIDIAIAMTSFFLMCFVCVYRSLERLRMRWKLVRQTWWRWCSTHSP